MAYITLPTPERTKTGLEAFSEGMSPYLQQAFAMILQRKMEEQQRQRAFEELGIGKQQLTPQGQRYAQGQLRTIEQGAPVQAEMPKIPQKYYKTVLDMEKAKQLPAGMKVPLGYGVEYNVPQPKQPSFTGLNFQKSIRAMAEREAFKRMGGSAFGGLQMRDEKSKKNYEELVDKLEKGYYRIFGLSNEKNEQEETQPTEEIDMYDLISW